MSEGLSQKENKVIQFDRHDLTPFEHLMIGSTTDVNVGGSSIEINSSRIKELFSKENTRKIFLSPINLTEGKKTFEDIVRAREKETIGPVNIFEFECFWKYLKRGINPTFKPGKLNEDGQLETFEIYLSQDGRKIDLPKDPAQEFPLNKKSFAEIVDYVGAEDGAMKFKIKKEMH